MASLLSLNCLLLDTLAEWQREQQTAQCAKYDERAVGDEYLPHCGQRACDGSRHKAQGSENGAGSAGILTLAVECDGCGDWLKHSKAYHEIGIA